MPSRPSSPARPVPGARASSRTAWGRASCWSTPRSSWSGSSRRRAMREEADAPAPVEEIDPAALRRAARRWRDTLARGLGACRPEVRPAYLLGALSAVTSLIAESVGPDAAGHLLRQVATEV